MFQTTSKWDKKKAVPHPGHTQRQALWGPFSPCWRKQEALDRKPSSSHYRSSYQTSPDGSFVFRVAPNTIKWFYAGKPRGQENKHQSKLGQMVKSVRGPNARNTLPAHNRKRDDQSWRKYSKCGWKPTSHVPAGICSALWRLFVLVLCDLPVCWSVTVFVTICPTWCFCGTFLRTTEGIKQFGSSRFT